MAVNLFDLLKDMVAKSQQRNRENPNVKTAPRSIFDKLRNKIEEARQAPEKKEQEKGGQLIDFFKEKMQEVKKQNQEDPQEETADKSVFSDFEEELRRLKEENQRLKEQQAKAAKRPPVVIPPLENKPFKVESNKPVDIPPMPVPRSTASTEDELPGTIAMTNSMGGSLGIRVEPDFGSGQFELRIPDNSRVTLLGYSQNAMMLDGKKTRWAQVDFQGTQGWIPESYLNFN